MVLSPFSVINHPGASRKIRRKNANSTCNENISLKHIRYEMGAQCSEETTGCKQVPGQICLQLQILDQDRKMEFPERDISEGAKLMIHYLEPRECGPGMGSGSVPGSD